MTMSAIMLNRDTSTDSALEEPAVSQC